jgi:hypothetical protein
MHVEPVAWEPIQPPQWWMKQEKAMNWTISISPTPVFSQVAQVLGQA